MNHLSCSVNLAVTTLMVLDEEWELFNCSRLLLIPPSQIQIFSSALDPQTSASLCFCLRVGGGVIYPYKAKGEIIQVALCNLIFSFLSKGLGVKDSDLK